ncbi:MAG: hypothetical protein AAFQ37_04020 [Bacteroidota bacterium]
MSPQRPPYRSPLFSELRAIEAGDHQRLIREYEEKEERIGQLDPQEYFELTVLYVDALFATGAHRRHMQMVDLVIFTSIEQNIQFLNGEDVYERMLFQKAMSAYRLQDYPTTEHITRELLRIYPSQKIHEHLLVNALFQQERTLLQLGRATAIFCVLLTALVIVLDLLIVKNFYPDWHSAMLWLRNIAFISGLVGYASFYGFAFYKSQQNARRYVLAIDKKKHKTKNT